MQAIRSFFDMIVNNHFAKDDAGRTVFFPATYGTARIVADADSETRLRRSVRHVQYVLFGAFIPAIGAVMGGVQPTGWRLLAVLAALMAMSQVFSGYLMWISRDLPRSPLRRSISSASRAGMDKASPRFLKFGMVTSALFTVTGLAMLVVPGFNPTNDPVSALFPVAFFGPLTVLYARALRRRTQS